MKMKMEPPIVIQTADKTDIIISPLQADLLKILKEEGAKTRRELIALVDKPRTTIYDNIVGLIQNKIVKKYAVPTNARGRPLVYFESIEG
jgi:predicted transcriptional regulator